MLRKKKEEQKRCGNSLFRERTTRLQYINLTCMARPPNTRVTVYADFPGICLTDVCIIFQGRTNPFSVFLSPAVWISWFFVERDHIT